MLLYGTVCVSLVWMHFSFKPQTKSPVAAPVTPLRKAA
jgi:NNP family nitrate/nitrite transporter-like MFS transporter